MTIPHHIRQAAATIYHRRAVRAERAGNHLFAFWCRSVWAPKALAGHVNGLVLRLWGRA